MPALTDDYREQLRLLGQRSGDQPNTLAGVAPTPADAWDYNSQAAQDWLAYQRSLSDQRGLWNSQTGWPTQVGMADAGKQMANALVLGTTAPGFRAFHGSPHSFDRFDTANIGTGEGAQAYGHGLYFAEREGVARAYRDNLSGPQPNPDYDALRATYDQRMTDLDNLHARMVQDSLKQGAPLHPDWGELGVEPLPHVLEQNKAAWDAAAKRADEARAALSSVPRTIDNPGHMYEVNVNANPEHFLDWDKPLSEQSKHVQEALEKAGIATPGRGSTIYNNASFDQKTPSAPPDPARAAAALREAGIPGIRYLDAGSRGTGEGTSNHVVFDADTIAILRKYGLAGLMAGGAAAGATKAEQ